MNIEYRSRRKFKRAVCIIVFFLLGAGAGYYLPARAKTEAKEEPSKIRILNFQKIQRLSEFKFDVLRLPGDRPQYRVHLTADMTLDESMMKDLFNQFEVTEGGEEHGL